jgi:hypothetical protein
VIDWSKVAGPWTLNADGYWIREDRVLGGYATRASEHNRASADAALRAAGWRLVDDDPAASTKDEVKP